MVSTHIQALAELARMARGGGGARSDTSTSTRHRSQGRLGFTRTQKEATAPGVAGVAGAGVRQPRHYQRLQLQLPPHLTRGRGLGGDLRGETTDAD